MLRRVLMLLAAVVALGMVPGATTSASARSAFHHASGCCGPLKPTYVHSNVYKYVTKVRHRDIHHTTYFPQYHPVIYVRHIHKLTNIHTITHIHIHKVGYVVDVPSSHTIYTSSVRYTGKTYTTVDCRCAKGSSRCK